MFNYYEQMWQWDSGIYIEVDPMPDDGYVHFKHDDIDCEALSVLPVNGKAPVPNEFLQVPGKLRVYAYILNTDGGRTITCASFTIKSRPKPPEYVYIPTPVITYPQLVQLVEDLNELKDILENPTASATGLPAGSSPTVTVTESEDEMHFSFGIPKGDKGDTGEGVAEGGTTNQVLAKNSNANYDTKWINVYNKTEVDGLITSEATARSASDQIITSELALKADKSTTYTKNEVDSRLTAKADKATTYTKTETDTLLSGKEDIANKVTSISSSSTNAQYPSAKLVYDQLDLKSDKATTYTKNEVDTALGGKVDVVEGKGLSTNDYDATEKSHVSTSYSHSQSSGNPHNTTANEINMPSTSAHFPSIKVDTSIDTNASNIATNTSSISAINDKIPSQASPSNQLADKTFVNSSIATNTATFRGTSAKNLTEEQFFEWANGLEKTNNDYVFWDTVDALGNTIFKRYKYNGTSWVYEYTLNNSSFTANQWSAINSGITSSAVSDITSNTAARHTHSNKSVLDGITSSKISEWDGKQDVLTAGSHISINSNTVSVTNDINPFYAEYNEYAPGQSSTYAQVKSAYDEGRPVYLKMNNGFIPLSCFIENSVFVFILISNFDGAMCTMFALNASGWNTIQTDLQSALVSGTNIKTINSSSILGSGNLNTPTGDSLSVVNNALVDTAGTATPVQANPSSAATGTLNSILIGDTAYTVGGGSSQHLYRHCVTLNPRSQPSFTTTFDIISTSATPLTSPSSVYDYFSGFPNMAHLPFNGGTAHGSGDTTRNSSMISDVRLWKPEGNVPGFLYYHIKTATLSGNTLTDMTYNNSTISCTGTYFSITDNVLQIS